VTVDEIMAVFNHPGFYRLEATNAHDDGDERSYQLGIMLRIARVDWFSGETPYEAIERAADAMRRVAAGELLKSCPNCTGAHFAPQGLCDICDTCDDARKRYPKSASLVPQPGQLDLEVR